ncbi:DUF1232 domain-containing protein [Streptococcus parauberis]|nr:DUF1232 domain-containing protein [Streptococcus parauberis]
MFKKKPSKFKLVRRFKHLKKDLPAVFLAMKNPNTPILAKLMALIIVVYALSPIDLIPDSFHFWDILMISLFYQHSCIF